MILSIAIPHPILSFSISFSDSTHQFCNPRLEYLTNWYQIHRILDSLPPPPSSPILVPLPPPPPHHHYTRRQRHLGAMDPNTKLILNEMSKHFSELDVKWEQHFNDLEHWSDPSVDALEQAAMSFDSWKPQIEASINDIRVEVGQLSKHWERSVFEHGPKETALLEKPGSASARPSARDHADGPGGHREDSTHRDTGFGSVLTYTHVPDKGQFHSQPPTPSFRKSHSLSPNFEPSHWGSGNSTDQFVGKLPKLTFPSFDGDNPKLWLSRSEIYFDMYHVHPAMWIRVATMHFSSAAARWLQSIEPKLKQMSWFEFSRLLLDFLDILTEKMKKLAFSAC